MGYIRAEKILPAEIIELIQQYVDGQNIYIPRKANERQEWGTGTQTKQEILIRNRAIYNAYISGRKVSQLACEFYLSEKTIQRIIRDMRQKVSA